MKKRKSFIITEKLIDRTFKRVDKYGLRCGSFGEKHGKCCAIGHLCYAAGLPPRMLFDAYTNEFSIFGCTVGAQLVTEDISSFQWFDRHFTNKSLIKKKLKSFIGQKIKLTK